MFQMTFSQAKANRNDIKMPLFFIEAIIGAWTDKRKSIGVHALNKVRDWLDCDWNSHSEDERLHSKTSVSTAKFH